MTGAILPEMRLGGFGRIINSSSVAGFLPGPFMGIYSASKHALEACTETLDYEVRRFGVRASLIEPALTKSKIAHNAKFAERALDEHAVQRQWVKDAVNKGIERGDDPRGVAEAVYRAAVAVSPRRRYPVGNGVTLSWLRRLLPASVIDWFV